MQANSLIRYSVPDPVSLSPAALHFLLSLRSRRKYVCILREINLSVFFPFYTRSSYVNGPPRCFLHLPSWYRHDLVAGLLGLAGKPLAIFIPLTFFFFSHPLSRLPCLSLFLRSFFLLFSLLLFFFSYSTRSYRNG